MTITGSVDAVAAALRHLGLDAEVSGDTVRLARPGIEPIVVTDGPDPTTSGPFEIVVVERPTAATRARLARRNVGWLDLSGHLRLRAGDLWIDADVPGVERSSPTRALSPLGGPVVAGVTMLALMAWPDPLDGIRSVARHLDVSPGGVSLAVKRLVEAGLLTTDHRAVPDLFWRAADEWRPHWIDLPGAAVPSAVAVGSLAAAQLGAPIAVGSATPTELLVADATQLKLAALRTSLASTTSTRSDAISATAEQPKARVAVAPSPVAAVTGEQALDVNGHEVAHRVIVALTLATDPARGAEIVRSWDDEPHVW